MNVRQHFRPDEQAFISQIQDTIATANSQYRPVLTSFLNPRQRFILQTLVNREDNIKCQSWGGYPDAEMQRTIIFPDYFQPAKDDFKINSLGIDYPEKFAELHHRQILGSILSKGVDRDKFGDIVTDGKKWQFLVSSELQPFFDQELTQVGKIHIRIKHLGVENILQPLNEWESVDTTVSSLRLDTVISAAFNYSRNRSKGIIEHQLARVNWAINDHPDYELEVHDIISVRHGGRIKIVQTNGRNKKGNIRTKLQIIRA